MRGRWRRFGALRPRLRGSIRDVSLPGYVVVEDMTNKNRTL